MVDQRLGLEVDGGRLDLENHDRVITGGRFGNYFAFETQHGAIDQHGARVADTRLQPGEPVPGVRTRFRSAGRVAFSMAEAKTLDQMGRPIARALMK